MALRSKREAEKGKKCTANKAFKCAFYRLLQTDEGSFEEQHYLSFLPCKNMISLWCTKWVCGCFSFRPKQLIERIVANAQLIPISYLHCYLSCPSFLGRQPKRSLLGFLLWPTVKRLEWNGLSQVVWAVGRWGHCCDSEVWATMQQKYPLHCELLSSFRSHSTSSPQCKSFLFSIPAVCLSVRHRTSSKGFGVGIEEDCGGRQGGRGERRKKKSAVTVVGGNAKQGSMPWVGKGA